MKNPKIILAIVLFSLIFIPLASAGVTCDLSNIVTNYTTGTNPSPISIQCSEDIGNVSVSTIGSYVSVVPSFLLTNTTINVQVSFDGNAPSGFYNNAKVQFKKDNNIIKEVPIFISVSPQNFIPTNDCQIQPSLSAFSQAVQVGSDFPLSKITFSPNSFCQGNILLDSSHVFVEGGIVTGGVQKPVSIASISSDGVSLNINTVGLNSQTYSSKLKISAYNKQFEIPITIIVTGGTSPTGNFDINSLPTCSTSANINLNASSSLVCTGLVPDVEISPRFDSDFIKGLSVKKESNQYTWTFQGKQLGNTKIYADFRYLGALVGDPFQQEIRIAYGNSPLSGTDLAFQFFQNGESKQITSLTSGVTKILVIDPKTNDVVPSAKIYLNGELIDTNVTFAKDKFYELRVTANGYIGKVVNFTVIDKVIKYDIFPTTGFNADTIIKINTTDPLNASIFIDGVKVGEGLYEGYLSGGNHEVKLLKQNYQETNFTISVESALSVSGYNVETFKKGTLQTWTLSKNASWNIYYQKDSASQKELKFNGVGTTLSFTPDAKGIWSIEANNKNIATYTIASGKIWTWITDHYLYSGIGLAVLVFVIYVYNGRRNKYTSPDIV